MNEVKIPKRLQQPFSRLMFWLARQYKKTDESLLGRLNSWQKSEIRSGQRFSKYYEAKSQLALSGFRITEIYTEDEIPKMLSAIYQKFSKELNEEDFPKTSTTYWASTGFSKIGSISNVAPKWSFTDKTITAKGLRKEIERIDIVFYKVLPSIVGLAFDIFLTEDARKTYEAMTVNSAVKPKTTLLSYYPSARFFRISGFNTIPTSFTNASTWIDSLLADTTRLVKDLFGGLISANLSMSMQHLPAIEIYVANPPISRPKQWLDKNHLFLHQFTGGFSDAFGTSGLLLLWAEKKIDSEVANNHKIIVSPKPFLRKSPIVSPGQVSTEYAHLYLSNYDMND